MEKKREKELELELELGKESNLQTWPKERAKFIPTSTLF